MYMLLQMRVEYQGLLKWIQLRIQSRSIVILNRVELLLCKGRSQMSVLIELGKNTNVDLVKWEKAETSGWVRVYMIITDNKWSIFGKSKFFRLSKHHHGPRTVLAQIIRCPQAELENQPKVQGFAGLRQSKGPVVFPFVIV